MESAILPSNQNPVRTYKQFNADSYPEKELPLGERMEFFYIGKNSSKIDLLIKSFKCGYAAESVENAVSILKRLSEKQNAPDIFIIEAVLGEAAVKELHAYISANTYYSCIPLLLDASDIPEHEVKNYKYCEFLDEIIFLEEKNNEKLVSKVEFLKKVKKHRHLLMIRDKIQTSDDNWNAKNIVKRAFDIIVSSLAIMLLSPLFLLIAIAIKLESSGPVFYISQRAGRGYRIFNFYKFRTMVLDADKKVEQLSHLNQYNSFGDGPVFFKIANDPRITRVGTFLRNSSLDELPQFFNVLMGDMSMVGNRPLPLYEAATLTTDGWAARFMAPAGITGLWQIKKRGHGDMSVEDRINLDIAYAQKYNFMYDLWIMANTPSALIQKSNR